MALITFLALIFLSLYTKEETRELTDCSQHCASCYDGTCNSCDPHYTLESNSCIECQDPYCTICSPFDNCSECDSSYFLSDTDVCCPNSCSNCTATDICTSCINGYYITLNNTHTFCTACAPECNTCDSYEYCTSCKDILHYYYGQCILQCNEGTTENNEGACICDINNCISCTSTSC